MLEIKFLFGVFFAINKSLPKISESAIHLIAIQIVNENVPDFDGIEG